MINLNNVHKSFGGIQAVNDVSVDFKTSAITGLIGPNGAGKTTLFNIIAGKIRPDSGQIWLKNENITGLKPHQLFNKGVLRTFQIAHEFSTLTVIENLMVVEREQSGESFLNACLFEGSIRRQEKELQYKAERVLEFLGLKELMYEKAGNLSGGQKKLLELGRTMMVKAKIVLLDEVGAGVNRTLLKTIGDAILRLNRERGYTFV